MEQEKKNIKMDGSCFMSPEELEKYKDLYISPEAMEEIRNWAIMSVTDEYIKFCFQTEEDDNVKA